MTTYFKTPIKYKRPEVSVQDMVKFIDKGEKFLKLNEQEYYDVIEYINGIIISPDYQRSYKSTLKEESTIIESLLLGIPIPEVFLIRNNKNQLQLRHVMDGQHRLNAIYRFVNNDFSLKGLEIRPEYNNRKFSEMEIDDKIKILGSNLSLLEFESFENPEEEIELFKRYNTNTKKLEAQEIEMVTYFSESNKYISKFINQLIESQKKEDNSDYYKLYSIYNVTNVRNSKQRNHQEICVILNIIENGLIDIRNASDISKDFLRKKSELFKAGTDENLISLLNEFEGFNKFILKMSSEIEFPFSPRILKDGESKLNKFSIGLAIVYATLWHYFTVDINSTNLVEDVRSFISKTPIADPDFKGSTTNLNMVSKYLFERNSIEELGYTSLILKN